MLIDNILYATFEKRFEIESLQITAYFPDIAFSSMDKYNEYLLMS